MFSKQAKESMKKLLLTVFLSPVAVYAMEQEYIKIRKAVVEDVAAIKELTATVWRDTYSRFYSRKVVEKVIKDQELSWLEKQIQKPTIICIVAITSQGRLVGVVTSRRKTQDFVKGIRLYVHPDYRNQSIGTQLIKNSMKYLVDAKLVRIEVKKDNERALNFYKRFGFKPVAQVNHTLYGETAINIVLEKALET